MNPKAVSLPILTLIVSAAVSLQAQTAEPLPTSATAERLIVVSLQDRRLALLEHGSVAKVYTVAVGRDSSPSPAGTFTIENRVTNPTYYHDGRIIPPGPENPVGVRWMGLSKKGYGIHGTNEPKSIGQAASHGCIRMSQPDLEDLFARVRTGDTVEIIGERDAETIALFGEPAAPAAGPILTARTAPAATQPSTLTDAAVTVAAAIPLGQ